MEILPENEKDFKTLASAAVTRHLNGEDFETAIAAIADKHNLNPEEVKRLVEKSNTALALEHLKTEDKKGVFGLAKYENVLKLTHPVTEDEDDEDSDDDIDEPDDDEKTASSRIPDTRKRYSFDFFGKFAEEVEKFEKTASRKVDGPTVSDYFALKRGSEGLNKNAAWYAHETDKCLHFLSKDLSFTDRQGISKFANECYTLYGKSVVPVLEAVCEAHNVRPKLRKVAGIIDDREKRYGMVKRAAENMSEYIKASKLAAEVAGYLK